MLAAETRLQASCVLRDGAARLLRMRYCFDCIKKNLILRKPRSGCLEGRTVLVPVAYQRFTSSEERAKGPSRSTHNRGATPPRQFFHRRFRGNEENRPVSCRGFTL